MHFPVVKVQVVKVTSGGIASIIACIIFTTKLVIVVISDYSCIR